MSLRLLTHSKQQFGDPVYNSTVHLSMVQIISVVERETNNLFK